MTLTTRLLTVLLFSTTMLLGCQSALRLEAPPTTRATAAYGQVPLSFEANHGQAKEPVKYMARGTNATLYLMPNEAALEVQQAEQRATIKMKLLGAQATPKMQGVAELPGKSNYFSGNDPKAWQTDIPTYQKVKYEEVYQGIDLVYYGNQQQLEYDFIVQPGADPNAIKFRLEGAEEVALNEQGELVLQTAAGEVKQHKPVVYQESNGKRQEIAGNYVLAESSEVHFALGEYDTTQPLVIDPVIAYATYLGGELGGLASVTVDKEGQAFVAMNYGPAATPGAYQNGTGFSVLKFNKTGTALLYSVTMGGDPFDRVYAMTVDTQGNCYLTGQAKSSVFPTTPGAFQTDIGVVCGGCHTAFVTKINATGSNLEYSTFLKGDNTTDTKSIRGQGIAVDAQGNAYVTGYTNAKDFPVTPGAFQTKLLDDFPSSPAQDSFVTKLNPTGTALLYSTYLGGGDNSDQGKNIAVDAAGNAYVTGLTGNGYNSLGGNPIQKTPFPQTPGAYQASDTKSLQNLYLTKFNATGSALIYSTIIGRGPSNVDRIGFAVDANGNAFLAGATYWVDYPVTPGAFQTIHGAPNTGANAFVTKVNPAGSGLIYSTFIGGNTSDTCIGLGLDPEGNAIITGGTFSSNFPQTNPPSPYTQGSYIAKLNVTGSQLLYSQVNTWARSRTMAVDAKGDLYIEGTGMNSFQPTPGVYQPTTPASTTLTKYLLPKSAVTVSAANYSGSPLASEAIVSTFGTGLATTTRNATTLPLPTTLGGTTIKVRDSAGTEREALLFFASPTQMNFQIPAGTANGNATITITAQDGATFLSQVEIANVVPSLFSADTTGRGVAAAHAQRTGSLSFEPVVKYDFTKGQWVALPIDLGPASEQVYLILYGTGIRLRSSLSNVSATIGGTPAQVSYAGAQPDFVGLDQVNLLIPRSLIGKGMVDVVLNVDGKVTNTLRASIK